MATDDILALVDGLTDVSADDIADIIANFSTDRLQQASAVVLAATQRQQQSQQQQQQQPQQIQHEQQSAVVAGAAAQQQTELQETAQQLQLQLQQDDQGHLYSSALLVNRTLETECQRQQQQEINDLAAAGLNGNLHNISCATSFDSVLCWPRTPGGSWAVLPCFEEFKGVHYDTTDNASRYCHDNGSWSNYSDYDKCHQAGTLPVIPDFATSIELPAIIYSIGYFISFAALVLALIIFLSFKDLKCLRNTIHANLFLTYITSALIWLLIFFLQLQLPNHNSSAACITLVLFYQYFSLTNFFWMFVEALYLYTLVVQTFSSENISFLTYALIGWGVPALVIFVWSVAKVFALPLLSENFNGLEISCPFMHESHIDWIVKGPVALIILLNLLFLIRIMWVLITKLRSANTLETRQYYKASKALLVLIPLFGITYLLVIIGPEDGISRNLFEAARAFLLSTQGFFVSLFFCFLNSEVRQALRHRMAQWRDRRNMHRDSSVKQRKYRFSKDYSQRSRTESLRTEEYFICMRPTQGAAGRGSLKRYLSVEKTDFV